MLQRVSRKLFGVWRAGVDLVTPPKCLVCRLPVGQGASLCMPCWQIMSFIDEPVCDALGTPFEFDHGEGALSAAAIANPPPWNKARAAAVFDDASQALIHQLKYQDHQEAGIAMAQMMLRAGRNIIAESDVILPVPLHRWRLWKRRFNQAAYLARSIAMAAHKPCRTDVLMRTKATRTQVGLTHDERRKNVRRAFEVSVEKRAGIEGKTVLLVDDVRTTGATVSACTRVLKDSGAIQVHVLTFALVLQPLRPHIEN